MKLALLGLVLVAITQWSFMRLHSEDVTLEFVEIVENGRGMEAETLAKFIERVKHPERFPGLRKVVLRGRVTIEEYRAVLRYLRALC